MNPNLIYKTQSTWSKGMQSKVMAARNDTNLLDKGAAILDNVSIMQQGGLRKRPCNIVSCDIAYPNVLGVVSFSDATLWVVSTDQVNSIAFNKVNDAFTAVKIVDITSLSPTNGNINFLQDQNVLLFTPQWVNVIYDSTTETFTSSNFVFNSYPVAQRFSNSKYFTTYDITIPIYIFYRGEGDSGSQAQAQTPSAYLDVGNTVGLWAPTGLVFNPVIPLGTIIQVNGLIIKVTLAPQNGGAANTYLEGILMIGSIPGLAAIKHDVYFRNDANTLILLNVYSLTTKADEPVFQNNSFGNPVGTLQLPGFATNYQNRIVAALERESQPDDIGGVATNNTTVWCSAAGNKFSYLQTTSEDDSPFSVTLSGDPTPIIKNLFADDLLYVFADTGVYAFVNQLNSTFSTNNINLRRVGYHRCSSTFPTAHGGYVFYVQENGKAILSLSPLSQDEKTIDMDRTILCPTFISNIQHLCSTNYIRSINDQLADNSTYLFALGDNINQDTGLVEGKCILSYQFVAAQDIDGWTRWLFPESAFQPTAIFTCKDRVFGAFTDNRLYEFVFGQYFDESSGGLPPKIKIQSNNFAMRDTVNGDLLFKRKRYGKIFIDYVNTETFILNGVTHVVGAQFNSMNPSPRTDILETFQTDTYEIKKFITIEHEHVSDLQILATSVGLEVSST